MSAPRLECRGLTGGWGRLTAFRDVDLAVKSGTMHAVLGPNGAGKTTLLLTIAGLLRRHAGSVTVDGATLRSGRGTEACRAGVVLVPDSRELFKGLTVEENLRVPQSRDSQAGVESMLELFPALRVRRRLVARALSGGEQQMLVMARALVQRPKVLLVDEMSMGLAPILVEHLFEAVREVATEADCAVVFVEQYVHLALAVADTASILVRGRITMEGAAADLAAEPKQLEHAYLGHVDAEDRSDRSADSG